MELTAKNLAEAKETVGNLLEQLGLTTYLFEVEPRADRWKCAWNAHSTAPGSLPFSPWRTGHCAPAALIPSCAIKC